MAGNDESAVRTAATALGDAPREGALSAAVMWRIRLEFDAMPGLCISRAQAEQLWQLERSATAMALEALVAIGYLRVTRHGFVRADMFQ